MKINYIIIGLVILCATPWIWPITTMLGITDNGMHFAIAMNAFTAAIAGLAVLFAGLTGGFPK